MVVYSLYVVVYSLYAVVYSLYAVVYSLYAVVFSLYANLLCGYFVMWLFHYMVTSLCSHKDKNNMTYFTQFSYSGLIKQILMCSSVFLKKERNGVCF